MIQHSEYLFCESTLLELVQQRNGSAVTAIDALTESQIVEGDLEEYATTLVQRYSLEPIELLTDKIETLKHDVKIDVQHDPRRMISDTSRPFYVPGTAITFVVPFNGDPAILRCRPQSITEIPPRGVTIGNEMHVTYEDVEVGSRMRAEFDKNRRAIQQHLQWGEEQVKRYNNDLAPRVLERLTERRNKFLQERRKIQELGFPLRERTDTPLIYSVPVQRKKVPIAKPTPFVQPRPIDPSLDMAAYESILQTIGSMARVLELNPNAFAKMGEESLRFMLLVPLNIHYEGQATGETFNWEGKTDIIIKVGGRNVFIAECLVWSGAEYFKSKIDQLLSYASWRDTKTAIIVFNRNKSLSTVLAQIPGLVTQHPNCKRHDTTYRHETGFRFVLHHRDDKNRELIVTVLVFDVPV